MGCDLEALAAAIPHQSGPRVGAILRRYAGEVRPGQAIVELGVWMGYGTAQLSLGAPAGVVVHGYDHFNAHADSVHKAGKQGVVLKPKSDTLPLVSETLAPFGNVVLHKGAIKAARWPGPAIGLHVDDACKREKQFLQALRIFSPWWVPGETVVVLMDFYYYKRKPAVGLDFQRNFVTAHERCFELLEQPGGSTAVFLYRGGLHV